MLKLNFFSAIFFLFLVSLEQFSKYIIRTSGGFYICNDGIAFGIRLFPIAFYFLWILIMFVLIAYFIKMNLSFSKKNLKKDDKIFSLRLKFLSLILIFSGAVSNMIDRIYFGCVIDFIDLRFWPVFNLADAYITLGAGLAFLVLFKSNKI